MDTTDYAAEILAMQQGGFTYTGQVGGIAPKQGLALEEHAKMLAEAVARARNSRRRVAEAADKFFGVQPEQPAPATMPMVGDNSIASLIRDLHDELVALDYQVGRL